MKLGGDISYATQAIGEQAKAAGYDVIRFFSERGDGANLAVLNNYNTLLRPQMIVPAPEEIETEFELNKVMP